MKYEELSPEDQALLNTEFPAELEKNAAEELKLANEMYDTGFTKMAGEAADSMDKEEEEETSESEKKLDDEQKKEAAARGAFIARGYLEGLCKQGQDRHGDPLHYLYPAIIEKLAEGGKTKAAKGLWEATKGKAGAAGKWAKGKASGAGEAAKKRYKTVPGEILGQDTTGKLSKAKRMGKHFAPEAGAGAALAAGVGGKKMYDKRKSA